jgi:hypothetical protein
VTPRGNVRTVAIAISVAVMLLLNEVFPTPWYVWAPAGLLAYLLTPTLLGLVSKGR